MLKNYVVKGAGVGLDGLLVRGVLCKDVSLVAVNDFNGIALKNGVMYISDTVLDELDDYSDESDDTYGKFQLEGRMECGNLRVSYAQFEKTLQITVFDVGADRTVYSQNFSKNFNKVKRLVEDVLKDYDLDIDDMVFKLKDLKEEEKYGEKA